jgi:hypothetical protein
MQKRLILALFLSIGCSSFAQRKIFPFEDYTKCYVGFLTSSKDTLWPAQFESAIEVYDYRHYYPFKTWIVKYQGRYGLLNESGEVILPFEYDELLAGIDNDSYVANKNGKTGIIKANGEILVSFAYDQIEVSSFGNDYLYYTPILNSQKGILLYDYRLIAEAKYNEIMTVDFETYYDGNSMPKYWKMYDSLHVGLINESGKMLFPLEFNSIDLLQLSNECRRNENYWFLEKENELFGLSSVSGETIIPLSKAYPSVYEYSSRNCQDSSLYFGIMEDEKTCRLMNLHTGEKSAIYDDLIHQGNFHIYHKKKEKGVLDEHMKATEIDTKYDIALFNTKTFTSPNFYYEENFRYREAQLIFDEDVIALSSQENEKRLEDGAKKYKSVIELFGFLNYKTGIQIKPKHHLVYRKTFNGKSFFWGITFSDFNNDKGELKIYSSDLKEVQSFEFQDLTYYSFDSYIGCETSSEEAFLIKNSAGLVGGINAKGDILLPFEYTSAMPNHYDREVGCFKRYITIERNGKKGFCDSKGKLNLQAEYDDVSFENNGFVQLRKGGSYSLLDSNLNLLITDCSKLFVSSSNGLNTNKLDFSAYAKLLGQALFYAIKNDSLYFLQGDSFQLVNEKYLMKKGIPSIVSYQILLGADCKVLSFGDRLSMVANKLFVVQSSFKLKIYSLDGRLLNEINDIKHFDQGSQWLDIKSTSNRWGAVDLETGKILIEPLYAEIYPFNKKQDSNKELLFWVSEVLVQNGNKGEWKLLNIKGEQQLTMTFDYPFYFYGQTVEIVRDNSKLGLIDADFNLLTAIEYNSIVEFEGIYFLKKNGYWSAFKNGRLVELKCNVISSETYSRGRMVFMNDQIGILGKDLDWILPLTKIDTAKHKENIASLLGVKPYDVSKGQYNTAYINDTSTIARKINNDILIELGKIRSTQYMFLEKTGAFYGIKSIVSERIPELRYLDVKVNYFSSDYLSVQRKHYSMTWEGFVHQNFVFDYGNKKNEYSNYRIHNGTYSKIELGDLFLPGSNYSERIDAILTSIINKKQLYGPVCVNLVRILQDYKLNFYLDKKGIYFCQPNSDYNQILIEYNQLSDILIKS